MRIIIISILLLTFLSLNGCSKKGNFDAGMAAYERNDYAAALKEFKPLAEHGNAEAQFYMGWMYNTSKGLPTDDVQMARWYRKAAEQGNVRAQRLLAMLYMHGWGVKNDVIQAEYWYLKAADQGYAPALNGLANIYRSQVQRGTTNNLVIAYALYSVSAKSMTWDDVFAGFKSNPAEREISWVIEKMTAEEIESGQALAGRMASPGAVLSTVLAQNKL